ncbi:hypothetical protein HHK36_003556 [Tetracentron sinense]|uniref:Glutamate receptor n=1 Tax=Tetracentron sinense TaxID=13715 RepID=A0A835DSL5_TETSI|nr:hypothetical protein HHK36_003556 [Tetracentron sinense]
MSSQKAFFFTIFMSFVLLLSHGSTTAVEYQNNKEAANIGAIIDVNSRVGKEVKTAMEIAIRDFNEDSDNNKKLVLHVRDSGRDPLRASSAADELIEGHKVKVVLGMETWQEALLVADAGNRAQVPVLSLATASITPPLTSVRWPFLVRMANNDSLQMRCVAAIVSSYQWRRVITIYEDDAYGSDTGMITLLSEALRDVGSEIEYRLVLPPFSSLSDPKSTIREELKKLSSKHSRVFIVVHSSLSLASHLFTEAKQKGIMGKESVWITTDSVTSLLDSANPSVISSMQGILGIKTYFSETSALFRDFYVKFRQNFRWEYQEEYNFEPGIHALRAYDTISTVVKAMKTLTSNSTSKMLLENVLLSNFAGLSGEISFEDRELSHTPVFRLVNFVGKSYKELNFWSPEFGFSESLIDKGGEKSGGGGGNIGKLGVPMNWPGGLQGVPKGRELLTETITIGVPNITSFQKFVKMESNGLFSGFCIEVFEAAVDLLRKKNAYAVPNYNFMPFDGSYDDLVNQVINKTFDAVVGDVTILADRSKYVEFTQPYTESGLSMIVPAKSEEPHDAWIFLKPFTTNMWLVTGAIFLYTMFMVWFLEHQSNPDFRGTWKNQVGTTLWFTFSTIFFTHGERLHRNFTRVVIVVWLFVVLILNSSYTASLSSMLTVQLLKPTVIDIAYLQKNNLTVGVDGYSFVKSYLVDVLKFKPGNIKSVGKEENIPTEFESHNIAAAFLEVPYARVFLSKYCNKYTTIDGTYRFGGLGFVFPKDSHLADDFSEAILELSESGRLKDLENDLFSLPPKCSDNIKTKSLSLHSFWGLFLITVGTSTVVFLLFLVNLIRNCQANTSSSDESLWSRTVKLVKYFQNGPIVTSSPKADVREWRSSSMDFVYVYNTPEHPQASPSTEIEMA